MLADDKVYCKQDAIAVVAAETEAQAQLAAEKTAGVSTRSCVISNCRIFSSWVIYAKAREVEVVITSWPSGLSGGGGDGGPGPAGRRKNPRGV
mgnify:CR=1 FL=1